MPPGLRLLLALAAAAPAGAATYYVDPVGGRDANSGLTPDRAWQTLGKAGAAAYGAGDRLLLRRGAVFTGTLRLRAQGNAAAPVVVDAFGSGAAPVIDFRGHRDGIALEDCRYVEVGHLAITADGSGPGTEAPDRPLAGVRIAATTGETRHIVLRGLLIHDIFGAPAGTGRPGRPFRRAKPDAGVVIETSGAGSVEDVAVETCQIRRTTWFGLLLRGSRRGSIQGVRVADNRFREIGGPGIQATLAAHLRIRGNTVDGSGSTVDGRMHGRGSGFWPQHCDDVIVEKNRFMHARGAGDSCGVHIDFDNRNVIVQYNLSLDNEGGFVEILGDNHDCCYRYNISVNDGARRKGLNGAIMDGKILWLSSFTGKDGVRAGPFDSYIYNNTIYVRPGLRAAFAFTRAAAGALIANNIFYLAGGTTTTGDDQDRRLLPATAAIRGVRIENNLYLPGGMLPPGLPREDGQPLHDTAEIVGDPGWTHPGGSSPADYRPANTALIEHRGIPIAPLPGDSPGVERGLAVSRDFFGAPIVGTPDLGAVQVERSFR